MDKVDFTAASLLNTTIHQGLKTEAKRTKSRDELKGAHKTVFSEFLEKSVLADLGPIMEFSPSEEVLTELMDAVHSTGSDLKDRPFADEILRYKRAVRNFIHYVIENGYEVEKTQGLKKKVNFRGKAEWNTPVYLQVKVIDKKLEELAAAILAGQITQLQRVSKIDEITGLLVDLTITGVIKERDDRSE